MTRTAEFEDLAVIPFFEQAACDIKAHGLFMGQISSSELAAMMKPFLLKPVYKALKIGENGVRAVSSWEGGVISDLGAGVVWSGVEVAGGLNATVRIGLPFGDNKYGLFQWDEVVVHAEPAIEEKDGRIDHNASFTNLRALGKEDPETEIKIAAARDLGNPNRAVFEAIRQGLLQRKVELTRISKFELADERIEVSLKGRPFNKLS